MKIAKKRRSAWDKDDSSTWSNEIDEAELISFAAHALSGALFLKFK
jgi:hypothetical protein